MDDRLREERRMHARTAALRATREVEYARANLESAVKRFLAEPNDKAYRAALQGRWNDLGIARHAAAHLDPSNKICACGACGRLHLRRGEKS